MEIPAASSSALPCACVTVTDVPEDTTLTAALPPLVDEPLPLDEEPLDEEPLDDEPPEPEDEPALVFPKDSSDCPSVFCDVNVCTLFSAGGLKFAASVE